MKFIFPQNYCFKQKLFGFIDYSTLFFNIILGGLIYLILSLFIKSLIFRISIFIILNIWIPVTSKPCTVIIVNGIAGTFNSCCIVMFFINPI